MAFRSTQRGFGSSKTCYSDRLLARKVKEGRALYVLIPLLGLDVKRILDFPKLAFYQSQLLSGVEPFANFIKVGHKLIAVPRHIDSIESGPQFSNLEPRIRSICQDFRGAPGIPWRSGT